MNAVFTCLMGVFRRVHFAGCISQGTFRRVHSAGCITQGAFRRVHFAGCISQGAIPLCGVVGEKRYRNGTADSHSMLEVTIVNGK